MPDVTNHDRADWARAAIDTYAAATRGRSDEQRIDEANPDNAEEIISDFLADLRHLVDELDLTVDFDALSARGAYHYDAEVREEAQVDA